MTPRPLLIGMGWFPDQAGGLNRYLSSLFAALGREQPAPTAIVLGPAANPPAGVHLAARSDDNLPRRLGGFARQARRLGPEADVIDVHFALYGLLPALLGSWGRKPLVVHFQGPWADESRAAGQRGGPGIWAKRLVELMVYRRAAQLVVLSSAFERLLVERYRVSPERVSVIPPGVDLDAFRPGSREDARVAVGLDPGAWTALAVRRLVPRMGLDILLRAWPRVIARRPDAHLVLAGEGPERARLQALAAEVGVSGSVTFMGLVPDATLRLLYVAADVAVVPTVALEGYGLVVLEALASGTPVVVSDAGGLGEAMGDLDQSSVVAAGDVAALGDRLAAAADGTRPLPSSAACRAHSEGFSWDTAARRNREVYARAAVLAG